MTKAISFGDSSYKTWPYQSKIWNPQIETSCHKFWNEELLKKNYGSINTLGKMNQNIQISEKI